jgi:hypothetical protein
MQLKRTPRVRMPHSVPSRQASATIRNNPPPTMGGAHRGPPCDISLQRKPYRHTVQRHRHTGMLQHRHIGISAYAYIGIQRY